MAGGKISEANIYGLTVRESATDGSDFSNPGADYRRLFLGEDGQLHVKDSAGAVTDIGAGSGNVATDAIWDAAGDLAVGSGANTAAKLAIGAAGGALSRVNGAVAWNSGTAFPTAATGDRFWRTDDNELYFYDGTRWLSVASYHFQPWQDAVTQSGLSVDFTVVARTSAPYGSDDAIYLEEMWFSTVVLTTNDGSNYWTLELSSQTTASATASLGTTNTSADSAGALARHKITVGAAIGSTVAQFYVVATKTSAPGNLLVRGCTIRFRRIGT